MPSTPAPRLRSAARDEVRTWSLSLDQMLPPDHPARAAWAFAEGVALAPLDGVGCARELGRLCAGHAAYWWLCGGVSVNHHTLAALRVAHPEPPGSDSTGSGGAGRDARARRRPRGAGPDARASTTDPDARVMRMADGGFRPACNVPLATD